MFWIRDLSDKDPYYILPILMGITMIIQQKLQPSQMDPRQARLMLLMPAFLTVLFLNFPAGLVLYWMTNNLLSIGQQVVTVRYFERAIHEPVRS
jgi:YidC/Oxa1 family membrane protein insertase